MNEIAGVYMDGDGDLLYVYPFTDPLLIEFDMNVAYEQDESEFLLEVEMGHLEYLGEI